MRGGAGICEKYAVCLRRNHVSTSASQVEKWTFSSAYPPGGSPPLGAIGFVNAALELKKQIANGEMPEPDYIYVACGTMGTAAGLTLGLRAAGLDSRVVSVRITSEKFVNTKRMIKLINKTNFLPHSFDASSPD